MSFDRVFKRYQALSPTTLIDTITSDAVVGASFTLLRNGGCAQGKLVLKDSWALKTRININDWISFEYSSGTRVYFGRVESITNDDPAGTTLNLYGMSSQLSEVFPGGFSGQNDNLPHLLANNKNLFQHDPDWHAQTYDSIHYVEDFISKIWTRYIQPSTQIASMTLENTSPRLEIESLLFRGEESALSIIKSVAIYCYGASWGVDANRRLFYGAKRSDILATYRTNVNCTNVQRQVDKSYLYNRILLTGGYIYGINIESGGANLWTGFYRYRSNFHVASSITAYGERRLRIYVPFIRRNEDARNFAREFFRMYAQPTTRYTFSVSGLSSVINPWDGRITLQDDDGTTLVTSHFDQIDYDFDHELTATVTLGPQEPQYPDGSDLPPQNYEIQPYNNYGDGQLFGTAGISSLPDLTGIPGPL
jgi:hypothetical protein